MSQILSKLSAIKNRLGNSVKTGSPAPTPLLKASIKSTTRLAQHRHKLSTVLRWLVGNAGQAPALAKVLVTAAFFGSLMLVALSIFFLPFPRSRIRPPQHTKTSPSNFYPRVDTSKSTAPAAPKVLAQAPALPAAATPSTKPSAAPSPAPSAVAVAPVTPKAKPETETRKPASVPITALSGALEKIREGQTPPERQKIALGISQTLLKEGKKDIALALLERVTGENPNWTDALLFLSAEYRKSNQLDASSGALLRILQVEPANALAYNNLGMIQMRKQKPRDAIPYLERSFAIDKKAPEVALNLGIAYEQTLIWGKSVQAYEHYLGLVHPKGGLSKDKVINAVKFRMQRLKAFARAQGTLEPQSSPETQLAIQPSTEEHEEDLPLATTQLVDPNPIQPAKESGVPATAVPERAPASTPTQLPTQLPTELKKGASP